MGALEDDLIKIFDKHNKNISLSTEEKNLLKKNYGKQIINEIEGYILVNCYLYDNDSINTIKKKISVFCDGIYDYNDVHLWGHSSKINYHLENDIKNFILENGEIPKNVEIQQSISLKSLNRDEIHLKAPLTLGVQYRSGNGIRILEPNPFNADSELKINFKDLN